MSRPLALTSHTLATTSSFAYTDWPIGSFDLFVLGSGSLLFVFSMSTPSSFEESKAVYSFSDCFYRHYKTIFWDKYTRSRLWWQWKKTRPTLHPKLGAVVEYPPRQPHRSTRFPKCLPVIDPLQQIWTFVKLTGTGIFLWPSRKCDIC